MGRQIGEEGEVTEWPRRRKLSLSFLKKSHEGQARFQVHLLSSILERGFLYNGIFLVMLPHRESWSSKRKQRKKAEKVRLAKGKDVLNHLIFLFCLIQTAMAINGVVSHFKSHVSLGTSLGKFRSSNVSLFLANVSQYWKTQQLPGQLQLSRQETMFL